MDNSPMPFAIRLWLSFATWLRVLTDSQFARQIETLGDRPPRLPEADPLANAPSSEPPSADAALQLLALLQREGRLVDFLQQDVESFPDAEIGAAARVVHTGCRKALEGHVTVEPIRSEDEESPLTLELGFDPAEVKLTGNVEGAGPHRGTLKHRGWRATHVSLPERAPGHDASVLAPAEVEL